MHYEGLENHQLSEEQLLAIAAGPVIPEMELAPEPTKEGSLRRFFQRVFGSLGEAQHTANAFNRIH